MMYENLLIEFKNTHSQQLNILMHLITTTIGCIGFINIISFQYIFLMFYSAYILYNTSYFTGIITFLYFVCIYNILNFIDIDTNLSYILIFSAFILQELSHYITNEQTLVSTYYNRLNFTFVKQYIQHTIFLVPLLIDTVFISNFDKILTNQNNLAYGDLEDELNNDIKKINEWVLEKNPSKEVTTHWWFTKLLDIKQSFTNIAKSKNLLNSLYSVYDSKMYNIERIESMDEIYVSSFTNKKNSDKVFYTDHIDGPLGILPNIQVYRTIIGITPNNFIKTNFPIHNKKYCITKGSYISFDYNRDIHYIYKDYSEIKPEYRVVLKAHYLIYPKCLKWYAKIYGYLCKTYNYIARLLFLYTLNPGEKKGSNFLVNIILNVTENWFLIEKYFGFNNIIYSLFITGISYIFNNWNIFIYATSFIHYFIYIGTYYYRENILYGQFKRDCIFYKSLSMINLISIYYNSIMNNIDIKLFIIIISGFFISISASYKLGKDATYFGSELKQIENKKIVSFPYNIIPHPMIIGQIISFIGLMFLSNNKHSSYIISLHISLYMIHLIQEIFDLNYKSTILPSIQNIVNKTYIYPIIWEDSNVDQKIMNVDHNDTIVTLTSGGDNVLDTLIHNPKKIYSIDMNKHQNYLLQLKIASIEVLDWKDFLNTFGAINSDVFYNKKDEILKHIRTDEAREWWTNNLHNIKNFNRSGSCGIFINIMEFIGKYFFRIDLKKIICNDNSIILQENFYNKFKSYKLANIIFIMYSFIGKYAGVPNRQIEIMELDSNLINKVIKYLLLKTNLTYNNHYYRFYISGLSENCCFNYMKEDNYKYIKERLNRIEIHTTDLLSFIVNNPISNDISKFILLDSQDWLEQIDLTKTWKFYKDNLNDNCEFFWRSSAPRQCIGVLENFDFKLKHTINVEYPNEYTDRVGMYRSIYYAKFKKSILIPNVIDKQQKLGFKDKLRVFKSMTLYGIMNKNSNDTHEEFLNKFYKDQAQYYDAYRREMLHGKKQLMYSIPYNKGMNILLVAGGTADILDYISDIIIHVNKITIVDLSRPLLEIAKKRIIDNSWEDKVELLCEDVTNFNNGNKYNLVIITYSLTMILDWKKTLDNINNLLITDGYLAISDFGISEKQNIISKLFWKKIFSIDNIYLDQNHWKYTDTIYRKVFREFKEGSFPLVPLIKCPYYFSLHQKHNL